MISTDDLVIVWCFPWLVNGDCRSQRTDRLWGWKYRIVSPTVGAGLRIKRGEERSDPSIRVWTWISRPAGYYQRGITIFATRQNKIQGIMSSVLFNWHSLTHSLSECQKLHLSSHNKWQDRGGTSTTFFFYTFCMQEARYSRPPISQFNLQTYLPDSPLPLSDMKENS